jgi:hypothetical protein
MESFYKHIFISSSKFDFFKYFGFFYMSTILKYFSQQEYNGDCVYKMKTKQKI